MKQHVVERMLYIVLALLFVVSVMAAILAIKALNALQEKQDQQQTILEAIGNTSERTDRSILCVLQFFSTPNHEDYYVSNLKTCEITSTNTGKSQVLTLPQSAPVTPSTPNKSDTPIVDTPPKPQPQKNLIQSTIDSLNKGLNNMVWGLTHLERNK